MAIMCNATIRVIRTTLFTLRRLRRRRFRRVWRCWGQFSTGSPMAGTLALGRSGSDGISRLSLPYNQMPRLSEGGTRDIDRPTNMVHYGTEAGLAFRF